jgi:hypothetical protein
MPVEPDDPYAQLEARGLEVVPVLIEHLDDPRLTRAVTVGFNNFPTMPRRVAELASDLLQDLAGEELGADWLDRQNGEVLRPKKVKQWWKKVKNQPEELYLIEHLVAEKENGKPTPNACYLRIMQAKYPDLLVDAYQILCDTQRPATTRYAAQCLADSQLSAETKVEAFTAALKCSDLEERAVALEQLERFDRDRFKGELIKELKAIPPTPRYIYSQCPQRKLASLAVEAEDEDVTSALVDALKRADPGLRLQLLQTIWAGGRRFVPADSVSLRLRLISQFIDDETVRVIPQPFEESLYDSWAAAFHVPEIAVGDYAGLLAGAMLELIPAQQVTEGWNPEPLREVRRRAKERLQRDGLVP